MTDLAVGQVWNVDGLRWRIVGFDAHLVLVKDAREPKKNFAHTRGAKLSTRSDFEDARLIEVQT